MAIQFNPYAGAVQSAITNPFQQKNDVVKPADRNGSPETQAASRSSVAESREPEARDTRQASANDDSRRDGEPTRTTGQRGSLLDVSV